MSQRKPVRSAFFPENGEPPRSWWLRRPGVATARDLDGNWHDRPRPPIVVRSRRSVGDFSIRTPDPQRVERAEAAREEDLKALLDRLAGMAGAAERRAARLQRDEDKRLEFRRRDLAR